MLLKICSSVVVILFGSAIASAQVTLEPKYPEGTKSLIHRESKTTQTLTLAGMNIDTKSSTFIVSGSSIGQRAADGTLKVEEKIDTMQSEISFSGGSIQFDSANPEKKADNELLEPVMELFRAIYRLPVTMELDAKNKVTAIKLPDGEYEKLPEAAKDRLNPETLKKAAEQATAYFPDGPVNKGDTWERSSESNLGAGQTLSFRTKYEYGGTIEKDGMNLDKITGKSFEVSFAINGNPMLQVTKSDLKIMSSESTYLFDRTKGNVVSHTSKTQIVGPLTLVINGMELPGKLDLTVEESSTRQK
jgi:hypothetical protein